MDISQIITNGDSVGRPVCDPYEVGGFKYITHTVILRVCENNIRRWKIMKGIRKEIFKRFLSVLLVLVFVMPVGWSVELRAADVELVTIRTGEIFEIRNVSGRGQRVNFSGTHNVYFDSILYNRSGGGYLAGYAQRGATVNRVYSITGGLIGPTNIITRRTIPAGGKMVIEVRGNGHLTASGSSDPSNFQIQQLVTPVLYTQNLYQGGMVTIALHENAVRTGALISWQPLGLPFPSHSLVAPPGTFNPPNPWRMTRETISPTGESRTRNDNHGSGGSTMRPGYTLIWRNTDTSPRPAWTIQALEFFGDYTAFSGQPYRLTIDGQRSFPPGMEQDLPPVAVPPQQAPPAVGDYTPIADLFPDNRTEIIQDMISRTDGQRPFSSFRRAHHVATRDRQSTDANRRAAYYEIILAMIRNERNTALRHVENSSPVAIIPIVGAPVHTAISHLSAANQVDSRRLSIEQIVLLMDLRENAYVFGSNSRNTHMIEAIDMILADFTSPNELEQMLRIVDSARNDFVSQAASVGVDYVAEQVLMLAFESTAGAIVKAISFVRSLDSWARDFNGHAVDSAQAIQGVREAVWRIWDRIIEDGKANGFSQYDLLAAHNMFMLSRYLVVEQLSWSAVILDGPTNIFNLGTLVGRSNWEQDVWIQDDLNYVRLLQTPADYPIFTQFNYRGRVTAPQRIVRFYNDGQFVRRSGWGTSNSTVARGTFFLDGAESGRLRTAERDYLFQINSWYPYFQVLNFDNGEYHLPPHGIPVEMIHWIITLQQPLASPQQTRVVLDGSPLSFDVAPRIIDGRVLVPFRVIVEALGAEVGWNESTQTVSATRGGTVITMPIGSTTPTVNGQIVAIDVPATIIDGRTLIPVRFISESLGVDVDWNGATQTVSISTQ